VATPCSVHKDFWDSIFYLAQDLITEGDRENSRERIG
jgi:hypothetical protein